MSAEAGAPRLPYLPGGHRDHLEDSVHQPMLHAILDGHPEHVDGHGKLIFPRTTGGEVILFRDFWGGPLYGFAHLESVAGPVGHLL